MANKPGGKMLLIITTCMSVIAAVSLFRDEPQHLLAGTKTALYNGQNVVYDSQKAGGSQVAYKTYCTDSNCTFQYAGESSPLVFSLFAIVLAAKCKIYCVC